MAKSSKSATLPPNLRHHPPKQEENETFFSKLKKKFKIKKGKYHVDVGSGDCENVSAVSFKKCTSSELLDTDQPLKHGLGRSSERTSRSESPKSNKTATRSLSERFVAGQISRPSHERKHSNPTYTDGRYPQMSSSEFLKSNKSKTELKNSKSDIPYKGNEYSVMKFDKEDTNYKPPDRNSTGQIDTNSVVPHNDSAIDLDHFEHDSTNKHENDNGFIDPGYERLPADQKKEHYTPVHKSNKETITPTSNKSVSSFEFDPHYESVHDVKHKLTAQSSSKNMPNTLPHLVSKSTESLDDPCYQSLNEVKNGVRNIAADSRKSAKTYDVSKSIESLDEPGYESLNDVKKRISEHFGNDDPLTGQTSQKDVKSHTTDSGNLNDSAVSFSMANESMTAIKGVEGNENTTHSTCGKLCDLSASQDSGFGSRNDKSIDETDCLYSTVKKKNLQEDMQRTENKDVTRTEIKEITKITNLPLNSSQQDNSILKKTIGETKPTPSYVSNTKTSSLNKELKDNKQVKSVGVEAEPLVPVDQRTVTDGYDSDTELIMDPGYAECADAIKGLLPYQPFSDGSESKISSCTSLDLSVEDFPPEPGYAECADAIKSGAIKKISVSVEKLIIEEDVKMRREEGGEIYANPQILFKKRSKNIESGSSDFSSPRMSSDIPEDLLGSSESLKRSSVINVTSDRESDNEKKGVESNQSSPEAPPLPARNYSLYLENEEAAQIMSEDDKLSGSDDAFELDNDILESVSNVSQQLDMLCKSPEECEVARTYSETFEVHQGIEVVDMTEKVLVDENISEIMVETEVIETESNGNLVENHTNDCVESDTNITNNGNLNERSETVGTDTVENECVHITVYDREGNTKVLTVIDKQASQRSGSKIVKIEKSVEQFETLETDSDISGLVNHDEKSDESDTRTDIVENLFNVESSTGNQNKIAYQTCNTNNSFNSAAIIGTLSDTITNSVSSSSSHEINDSHEYPTNSGKGDTVIIQDTQNSMSPTQTVSVPVHQVSSLEVVKPVKMHSISWDSDEEFQGSEPLPKLEIVESDLENVFESSDSSGKLGNESVECECAERPIECANMTSRDGMENTNETVTLFELPVTNFSESKSECCDSGVQDELMEGLDDVDSGHFEAVEQETVTVSQSDVDVITSADEALTDKLVQNKHNTQETLDCKSSSEGPMELQSENMCNSDATETLDSEGDVVQPKSHSVGLPILYSHPSWYNDSEPTHMSLTELMTLSSASDSVLLVNNHSTKHCASQSVSNATNSEQNESVLSRSLNLQDEQLTPPPRPPTYNSSQSRDRYSSSSQSGHSSASSPQEDTLPGFRFAEPSLSDVDEAPPAIPPRTRLRKVHHRRDSSSQDFMESMRQLKDCGWYWGPLSWEEAEQKLANKPEGTFLVRDSSDERYILSLSFKNQGRVHHTRIEHHRGNFSFWSQPDSHGKSTIKEFIEQCVHNSENGRFLYFIRPSGPGSPPLPIHLLYPVSRFVQMQSLQHMCRFRILQMVRRDHIDDLPVPTRIKQYLKEAQYYVEYLDD